MTNTEKIFKEHIKRIKNMKTIEDIQEIEYQIKMAAHETIFKKDRRLGAEIIKETDKAVNKQLKEINNEL